jgi:hypothetical protein
MAHHAVPSLSVFGVGHSASGRCDLFVFQPGITHSVPQHAPGPGWIPSHDFGRAAPSTFYRITDRRMVDVQILIFSSSGNNTAVSLIDYPL